MSVSLLPVIMVQPARTRKTVINVYVGMGTRALDVNQVYMILLIVLILYNSWQNNNLMAECS